MKEAAVKVRIDLKTNDLEKSSKVLRSELSRPIPVEVKFNKQNIIQELNQVFPAKIQVDVEPVIAKPIKVKLDTFSELENFRQSIERTIKIPNTRRNETTGLGKVSVDVSSFKSAFSQGVAEFKASAKDVGKAISEELKGTRVRAVGFGQTALGLASKVATAPFKLAGAALTAPLKLAIAPFKLLGGVAGGLTQGLTAGAIQGAGESVGRDIAAGLISSVGSKIFGSPELLGEQIGENVSTFFQNVTQNVSKQFKGFNQSLDLIIDDNQRAKFSENFNRGIQGLKLTEEDIQQVPKVLQPLLATFATSINNLIDDVNVEPVFNAIGQQGNRINAVRTNVSQTRDLAGKFLEDQFQSAFPEERRNLEAAARQAEAAKRREAIESKGRQELFNQVSKERRNLAQEIAKISQREANLLSQQNEQRDQQRFAQAENRGRQRQVAAARADRNIRSEVLNNELSLRRSQAQEQFRGALVVIKHLQESTNAEIERLKTELQTELTNVQLAETGEQRTVAVEAANRIRASLRSQEQVISDLAAQERRISEQINKQLEPIKLALEALADGGIDTPISGVETEALNLVGLRIRQDVAILAKAEKDINTQVKIAQLELEKLQEQQENVDARFLKVSTPELQRFARLQRRNRVDNRRQDANKQIQELEALLSQASNDTVFFDEEFVGDNLTQAQKDRNAKAEKIAKNIQQKIDSVRLETEAFSAELRQALNAPQITQQAQAQLNEQLRVVQVLSEDRIATLERRLAGVQERIVTPGQGYIPLPANQQRANQRQFSLIDNIDKIQDKLNEVIRVRDDLATQIEEIDQEISNLPQSAPKQLKQVTEQLLGRSVKDQELSNIIVDDVRLQGYAEALFDPFSNALVVTQKFNDELLKSRLTMEQLDTLAEEVGHNIQTGLGSVEGFETFRSQQTPVNRLSDDATVEEIQAVSRSVSAYGESVQDIERDAKIAADRAVSAIDDAQKTTTAIQELYQQYGYAGRKIERESQTALNESIKAGAIAKRISQDSNLDIDDVITRYTAFVEQVQKETEEAVKKLAGLQKTGTTFEDTKQVEKFVQDRIELLQSLERNRNRLVAAVTLARREPNTDFSGIRFGEGTIATQQPDVERQAIQNISESTIDQINANTFQVDELKVSVANVEQVNLPDSTSSFTTEQSNNDDDLDAQFAALRDEVESAVSNDLKNNAPQASEQVEKAQVELVQDLEKAEVSADQAGGALTVVSQKSNGLSVALDHTTTVAKKVGKTLLAVADFGEQAAFSLVPGGAMVRGPLKAGIRSTAKNVAAPIALSAAAAQLPGGEAVMGAITHGIQTVIAPLINGQFSLLASGLESSIINAIPAATQAAGHAIAATNLPGAGFAGNIVSSAGGTVNAVLSPIIDPIANQVGNLITTFGELTTSATATTTAMIGAGKAIEVGGKVAGKTAINQAQQRLPSADQLRLPGTAQVPIKLPQKVIEATELVSQATNTVVDQFKKTVTPENARKAGEKTRELVDATVEGVEKTKEVFHTVAEKVRLVSRKLPEGISLEDLNLQQLENIRKQLFDKLIPVQEIEKRIAQGDTSGGVPIASSDVINGDIRRVTELIKRRFGVTPDDGGESNLTLDAVAQEVSDVQQPSEKVQKLTQDKITAIRDVFKRLEKELDNSLDIADPQDAIRTLEGFKDTVKRGRIDLKALVQELKDAGVNLGNRTDEGKLRASAQTTINNIEARITQRIQQLQAQVDSPSDLAKLKPINISDQVSSLSEKLDQLATKVVNKAFDVDGDNIKTATSKAVRSQRGRDLAVNAVGAGVGAAVASAGPIAAGGAELIATLTARLLLAQGGDLTQQGEALAQVMDKLGNSFTQLQEITNDPKLRQQLGDDLFNDISGFIAGQIGAIAGQVAIPGVPIPVGAITASIAVPQFQQLRQQSQPKQLAKLSPEEEARQEARQRAEQLSRRLRETNELLEKVQKDDDFARKIAKKLNIDPKNTDELITRLTIVRDTLVEGNINVIDSLTNSDVKLKQLLDQRNQERTDAAEKLKIQIEELTQRIQKNLREFAEIEKQIGEPIDASVVADLNKGFVRVPTPKIETPVAPPAVQRPEIATGALIYQGQFSAKATPAQEIAARIRIPPKAKKEAKEEALSIGGIIGRFLGKGLRKSAPFVENSYKVLGESSKAASKEAKKELGDFFKQLRKEFNNIQKEAPIVGKSLNFLKQVGIGALATFGVFQISDAIVDLGRKAFQTTAEVKALESTLKFTSGVDGTKNLAFINAEVDRLKVALPSTISGFIQLNTAAEGSSFAGQGVRDVYSDLLTVVRVYNKSADEQTRITAQLAQGLNKGKVELEDIKSIAEAGIPIFGAVEQATGSKVNDLTAAGELFFEDVAAGLDVLASKANSGVAAATETPLAKMAEFETESTRVLVSIGETLAPVFSTILNVATKTLKFVAKEVVELSKVFEILALPIKGIAIVFQNVVMPIVGPIIGTLAKAFDALVVKTGVLRGVLAVLGGLLSVGLLHIVGTFAALIAGPLVGAIGAAIGAATGLGLTLIGIGTAVGLAAANIETLELMRAGVDKATVEAAASSAQFAQDTNAAYKKWGDGIALTESELKGLKQQLRDQVAAGQTSEKVAAALSKEYDRMQAKTKALVAAQRELEGAIKDSAEEFENQREQLLNNQQAYNNSLLGLQQQGQLNAEEVRQEQLQGEEQHTANMAYLLQNRINEVEDYIDDIERLLSGPISRKAKDTQVENLKQQQDLLKQLQSETLKNQESFLQKQLANRKDQGDQELKEIDDYIKLYQGKINESFIQNEINFQEQANKRLISEEEHAEKKLIIKENEIKRQIELEQRRIDLIKALEPTLDLDIIDQRNQQVEAATLKILELKRSLSDNTASLKNADKTIIQNAFSGFRQAIDDAIADVTLAERQRILQLETLFSGINEKTEKDREAHNDRIVASDFQRIQEQLEIEQEYLDELERLPLPDDPDLALERQREIRSTREKTTDLVIELIKKESEEQDKRHQKFLDQLQKEQQLAENNLNRQLELRGELAKIEDAQQSLTQSRRSVLESEANIEKTLLDIKLKKQKAEGKEDDALKTQEKILRLEERQLLLKQQQAREDLAREEATAASARERLKIEQQLSLIKAKQAVVDAKQLGDTALINDALAQVGFIEQVIARSDRLGAVDSQRFADQKQTLQNNQKAELLQFRAGANETLGRGEGNTTPITRQEPRAIREMREKRDKKLLEQQLKREEFRAKLRGDIKGQKQVKTKLQQLLEGESQQVQGQLNNSVANPFQQKQDQVLEQIRSGQPLSATGGNINLSPVTAGLDGIQTTLINNLAGVQNTLQKIHTAVMRQPQSDNDNLSKEIGSAINKLGNTLVDKIRTTAGRGINPYALANL